MKRERSLPTLAILLAILTLSCGSLPSPVEGEEAQSQTETQTRLDAYRAELKRAQTRADEIKHKIEELEGYEHTKLAKRTELEEYERTQRLAHEIGMRWITVPGGSFMMGSNDGYNDEKPVHQVKVSAFRIAESEVTVRQYQKCVEAGVCTEPNTGDRCTWGKSGYDDHPVNCVDWGQARTFSRWVGGDLPTEAQWEYAARGGQGFKYSGSDDASAVGWYGESYSSGSTHPVKQKQKNGYGLYDMSGNVWEWTLDEWHISYNGAPSSGDQPWGLIPTCNTRCDKWPLKRVSRGGSWNNGASPLRIADRNRTPPDDRYYYLGFRSARPVPQSVAVTLEAYRAQERERAELLARERGIQWVTVPGTLLIMNSDNDSYYEELGYQVFVSSFQIAESEVTVRQYRTCVEAGVCTEPNTGNKCTWGKPGYDDYPINCVDWGQARIFSRWVGGDLPTEAQWESAARGGQDFKYSGSDNASEVGWYGDSSGSTHPVKRKQKNGYGLYDMSGNVQEWTLDDTGSSERVIRGGDWRDSAWGLSVVGRSIMTPDYHSNDLGFRPVRLITP